MGRNEEAQESKTAYGGTDYSDVERHPSGHQRPESLPQAWHLGCRTLSVVGEVRWSGSQRYEQAPTVGRRKPAVEAGGVGASAGHESAEGDHRKTCSCSP